MQNRFVGTFLLLALLSACSPTAKATPPATAAISTEAPPTSISTSTGACPAETAELKLFTNTEDGYCLLYPMEDSISPPALIVINPTGMPGDQPGDFWLQISVEDASGRMAAQAADQKIAEAGEGFNITRSEMLIDGQQAVVVDGLPGQDAWRGVFIVNNDRLYTLSFTPWAPNADGFPQLEKLYSAVIDSLHFIKTAS